MSLDVEIESWPGSPERPNEDWADVEDDVVIVLDGAGIPKELPTGCKHSVEWFVNQLGPALLRHAADRTCSLSNALECAIVDVRRLHEGECDLSNPNSPSATVVMLRLNGSQVEGLVLADSSLVVALTSGEVVSIWDGRLQQIKDRLADAGQPVPSGSAMSEYRNQPGGFWVAGAMPEAASQGLTAAWEADMVASAALLTDGAARYVDLFAAASWTATMRELNGDGPAAVLKQVREIEDSDPYGRRWKRSKPHDDATIAHVRCPARQLPSA